MQWFQYREGVVLDSLRITHYAAPSASRELKSLCRRKFHPEKVEEVSEPDKPRQPGLGTSLAPCVQCLLLAAAAPDAESDAEGGNSRALGEERPTPKLAPGELGEPTELTGPPVLRTIHVQSLCAQIRPGSDGQRADDAPDDGDSH